MAVALSDRSASGAPPGFPEGPETRLLTPERNLGGSRSQSALQDEESPTFQPIRCAAAGRARVHGLH